MTRWAALSSLRWRLLAATLAASLGGCTGPGDSQAYTGPGLYLEKSYFIVGVGPKVFGRHARLGGLVEIVFAGGDSEQFEVRVGFVVLRPELRAPAIC